MKNPNNQTNEKPARINNALKYPCPRCGNDRTHSDGYGNNGKHYRKCPKCGKKHTCIATRTQPKTSKFSYELSSDKSEREPTPISFNGFLEFLSWVRLKALENKENPNFEGVIITPMPNGKFHLEVYDDFRE